MQFTYTNIFVLATLSDHMAKIRSGVARSYIDLDSAHDRNEMIFLNPFPDIQIKITVPLFFVSNILLIKFVLNILLFFLTHYFPFLITIYLH